MSEFMDFEMLSMGTIITQRIYSRNAKIVSNIVNEEIKKLEEMMSFFKTSSDVSKLNNAAGISMVSLDTNTFNVIKNAKIFSESCNGAFDITIGALVKLWGIFTETEAVPQQTQIYKALELVNYKDIILDEEMNSAMLLNKGEMIDLGAIAKGYAADKALEIYQKCGIESAFINLGGNVHALGNKPDGSPWKIGLQNPWSPRGDFMGVIDITNKTVVTSGDYVRYFEKDNKKYHHILDPRTGYPADTKVVSATIVGDNSMQADALSTAVFILGVEKGMELIKNFKGLEAIFITQDKKVHITEGLKKNFIFDNEKEWQCII